MSDPNWRKREHAPLTERFWAKVQKTDGCWNWTGNRSNGGTGYGQIYSRRGGVRKLLRAHRLSWELAYGEIPKGMGVLHHCDNKTCVRPDHLFLGDQRANALDDLLKGKCHRAKLNPDDVREVRRLRALGVSPAAVAARFSISTCQVRTIVRREQWSHVL